MTKTRLLGKPIHAVGISGAAHGMYNGRHYIYAVSSGEPCVMFVIDALTATCVKRMEMSGSSHNWGVSVTSDGTVYAGGDGIFYRYVPGSDSLESLGVAVKGENYFWLTTVDDQDYPYCGTFPNGKVFRYEPENGIFRDYGQMVEHEQYVRSIVFTNGKIYAGIGTTAHIIELDPHTGAKREIELPEECKAIKFVYHLSAVDTLLFALINGNVHIYDLAAEQWIGKLDNASGVISTPDAEGNIYFIQNGLLTRMNIHDLVPQPTTFERSSINNIAWIEYPGELFPGRSLISMNSAGFWIYNPATGHAQSFAVEMEGQPIGIQSLTTGADGTIHIGAYFLGGYASYHPQTDAFTPSKPFGQPENMLVYRDQLYLGVYTGGRIFRYDPAQPWQANVNPKLLFSLKEDGQDRPFALTSTNRYLVAGSVPAYGTLGGVLALYDPETEEKFVHKQLVQNQSVICLTSIGDMVFGGTSVYGGLGVRPSETQAYLFMFDTTTQQKVWEGAPVEGDLAVSAVCPDDKGNIWGLTPSSIFRFNPQTKTFEFIRELQEKPDYAKISQYWRCEFIEYDVSGCLYGNFRNKLFRYHIADDQFDVLEEKVGLFTRDLEGNLYFARATELYQYKIKD